MSTSVGTAVSQTAERKRQEVFKAYLTFDGLSWGGVVLPNWTEDGAGLCFAECAPTDTVIMRADLNTGDVAPMFDVLSVRAALTAATGHEPPYRGLPFESFKLIKDGLVEFTFDGSRWSLDPIAGQLERRGADNSFNEVLGWEAEVESALKMWTRLDYLSIALDVPEQRSPCGEWLASIRDNNVSLRSAWCSQGPDRKLTVDGTSDCFWDIEARRLKVLSGRRVVFREVSPWSPDSLALLAYRRDLRGVHRIPRVSWLKPFIDAEYFSWQMAGARLDRVSPVLLDVRGGRQIRVPLTDIDDRYIQWIGWRPDGSEAMLIVYTREFKRVDILAVNRSTGAVRPVLTESAETFVKVQHDAIFAGEHGFYMFPDGNGFLWMSTRDGWNHLYHYDISGRLLGRLTRGDWPVHEVNHIDPDGFIYFTASIDTTRPYDVHVCRVALHGGLIERLTKERGLHAPTFAPSGQAFLDTHSAVDRPTRTELVRADGTMMRVLSEMDISRLEAKGYTAAEEFVVKGADRITDLWGVMYKPFDFDASRSYPVIEYIYGGPQTVEAARYFAIDKTMIPSMRLSWAIAQLGYVVICLDARGTPGRSKAFHDAIYGDWTVGVADHAAAIRQLCDRFRWMDSDRVGITGHSWGGYFSTCALMHAPDVYHAAVSYAPHYDPWDGMLSEPYLNLPARNRAAYEHADLYKQASKVRGRLMIVAGSSDNGFSTVMKMTRALIEAGVDHEFVVVPHGFHHFSGVEEDYLHMKLTGWFDRYVKHRKVA